MSESICEDVRAPVHCYADHYNGQELTVDERIHAWAANQCKAEKALKQSACETELDPKLLTGILCAPFEGECPPEMMVCAAVIKPTTCRVTEYAQTPIPEGEHIEVSGSNECEAQSRIRLIACRRNLDPKLLTMVCNQQDPS